MQGNGMQGNGYVVVVTLSIKRGLYIKERRYKKQRILFMKRFMKKVKM